MTLIDAVPAPAPQPAKLKHDGLRYRLFGRQTTGSIIFAGYLPMIVGVLIIGLPLLWMALSSFKPDAEIVTTTQAILPQDPSFENYAQVAKRVPLPYLFRNSIIVTIVGAAIKVFLAITTAYAIVFIDIPGRNAIFLGIMVALMVPTEAAMLPNYITISSLGGVNTLWGVILPGLGTAFGTFLLRQQYKTVPKELLEAAELDGAGHWRRLWQVVVPVTTPTIATVALVTIVSEWNGFLWPLIITSDAKAMTLPVGLTMLQQVEGKVGSYGTMMAGAVLVLVPVLILFAFLQRYIVAGLTQGAVKS